MNDRNFLIIDPSKPREPRRADEECEEEVIIKFFTNYLQKRRAKPTRGLDGHISAAMKGWWEHFSLAARS